MPTLSDAEFEAIRERLRLARARQLDHEAFVRLLFEDQDALQAERHRYREVILRLVAVLEFDTDDKLEAVEEANRVIQGEGDE